MSKFKNKLTTVPIALYLVALILTLATAFSRAGKGAGTVEVILIITVTATLTFLLAISVSAALLCLNPFIGVATGFVGLLLSLSLQLYPIILDAISPISTTPVPHDYFPTPLLNACLVLLTLAAFAVYIVNAVRMRRTN